MRVQGRGLMGQAPGLDWAEVKIPYRANRNERDVEEGNDHTDLPCWAIWDWLEAQVPDLHKQDNAGDDIGPVSWMRASHVDKFIFHFEDHKIAMLFKLTFA